MTLSEIRAEAGRRGGNAPHKKRGFQTQTPSWRKDNARRAGKASVQARKEASDRTRNQAVDEATV